MGNCAQDSECRPVLTVSVAAYNVEGFITRCLDSCLGCKNGELDVIVVDDGSTDGTSAIADAYAERYPDIIRVIHKENGHYGSTVNASLTVARGKYYRLLDSDDWFDPECLDKWLDVLMDTEADAVCTSSIRVMEQSGSKVIMDPWPDVPSGEFKLDSLDVTDVPGPGISNLAYRTDFLRDIGLRLLEGCNYVDEELRCIPWCHVSTVRVDHIPVYRVLKERSGQNTSFEGICGSASDKGKMFFHVMKQVDLGIAGARTKAQNMALKVASYDIAAGFYYFMLLKQPEASVKCDIAKFDYRFHSEAPEIYELVGKNCRAIRLLRASRFILYPLIAKRVRHQFEKSAGGGNSLLRGTLGCPAG